MIENILVVWKESLSKYEFSEVENMLFVEIDCIAALLIIIGVLIEKISNPEQDNKNKKYRGRHSKSASHFRYERSE